MQLQPWTDLEHLSFFSSPYWYKPLVHGQEQIRIIHLLPPIPQEWLAFTVQDDLVSCKTNTISIQQQTHSSQEPRHATSLQYESVSYCWGPGKATTPIIIDGRRVDVPRSCEAALRRLRYSDRERILWIDAICIDQNSHAERSFQVAMMDKIYRAARQNLVYLGDADEFTEKALQAVQVIMKTDILPATRIGKSLVNVVWRESEMLTSDTGLESTFDQDALLAFYARPWFGRLWVLQEMALAHRNVCVCGDYEFDLYPVLMVAQWMRFKLLHLDPRFRASSGILNASRMLDFAAGDHSFFAVNGAKKSLEDLLITARSLRCSDPRDKVFATLGLVDWERPNQVPWGLMPNYRACLPSALEAASRHIMTKGPSVGWVSHRSVEDMHVDMLPSWVPRWHRQIDEAKDVVPLAGTNSSPGFTCDPQFDYPVGELDGDHYFTTLTVSGFVIDKVLAVHDTYDGPSWYMGSIGLLRQICNKDDEVDAVVCHVLTAGAWMSRPLTPEHLRIIRQVVQSLERGESDVWSYNHTAANLEPYEIDKCVKCFKDACGLRRLCTTQQNLPSLVPHITRPTDIIVQLLGAATPCVLRPTAHVCGQQYEVVGPTYIYGMMSGEALGEWQAEGGKEQIFELI